MSCRVLESFHLVMPPADDLALMHDHGSDGDLVFIEGPNGLAQGLVHPLFVLGHAGPPGTAILPTGVSTVW